MTSYIASDHMSTESMMQYPNPSQSDQNEFLIRLYFGAGNDLLDLCLGRAYLDFSRTLHGIAAHPSAYPEAKRFLRAEFSQLSAGQPTPSSECFDAWHAAVCSKLKAIYAQHGHASFYIGQAQKWINMTFKYVYVMGEAKLPGFASFYGLCHMPIDNIILKRLALAFASPPRLAQAWSRMESYEHYMEFQRWIRGAFKGSSPLAVEFKLWQELPNEILLE